MQSPGPFEIYFFLVVVVGVGVHCPTPASARWLHHRGRGHALLQLFFLLWGVFGKTASWLTVGRSSALRPGGSGPALVGMSLDPGLPEKSRGRGAPRPP